jgi:hypothetical protein
LAKWEKEELRDGRERKLMLQIWVISYVLQKDIVPRSQGEEEDTE